jgi:putative transposase
MRKSKFTDSQIMDAVKRVEAGFAVPDICRELGISTATFYKWRAKYGGMDVSMMSCHFSPHTVHLVFGT